MNYLTKILVWTSLALSGMAMISAVQNKKSTDSKEVEITVIPTQEGQKLITDEEILDVLKRHFGFAPEGVPLGVLELDTIETVLENVPFVRDAEVYLDAGGQVNIDVEQRRPVARFLRQSGEGYYVDHRGFIMPVSRHFTVRVPVVTGTVPKLAQGMIDEQAQCLRDIWLLAVELDEDPFLRALIEQIHMSSGCEVELIPKVGHQKIWMGKLVNVEDKLERLATYYDRAIPVEGWRAHSTVNLEFEGQIVCKKR